MPFLNDSLLKKLEVAHYAKDFVKQVPLYTALAQFYERKATRDPIKHNSDSYLKAAACYHFSLGAMQQSGMQEARSQREYFRLIKTICALEEKLIDSFRLENASINIRNIEGFRLLENNKLQLLEIRERARQQLALNISIRCVNSEINYKLRVFYRSLLNQCYNILGRPPCRYAIIAFGSLARSEATPYSDFEWGILMEEETATNVAYFENLTRYMNLKILNLGETSPKIEHLTKEDGRTQLFPGFFDYSKNPVKKGIALDSKEHHGCKSPLGNEHLSNQPISFRLIHTPAAMAAYYNAENFQTYPSLPLVIRTFCFLEGYPQIAEQYRTCLKQQEQALVAIQFFPQQAMTILLRDLSRFEPRVGKLNQEGRVYLVKYELYRLPNIVLDGLALYYQLHEASALQRVRALSGHLNAQAQQCLYAMLDQTCEVRLKQYLQEGQQSDEMLAVEGDTIEVLYEKLFYLLDSAYYFCLGDRFESFNHPQLITHMAKIRVAEKQHNFEEALNEIERCLNDYTWNFTGQVGLYHFKGRILTAMTRYQEAREAYEKVITLARQESKPAFALVAQCELLKMSSVCDDPDKVRGTIQEIEQNFKTATDPLRYTLEERCAVQYCLPHSYHAIGSALTRLREYEFAIGYLHLAIKEERQIMNLDPEEINADLILYWGDLVNAYSGIGMHTEAVEYTKRCIKEAEKWYGDRHPKVGVLYYNWGGALLESVNIYCVKEIMQKHRSAVEDSREVLKKALTFNGLSLETKLLSQHKLAVIDFYSLSSVFERKRAEELQERLQNIITDSAALPTNNIIKAECLELKGNIQGLYFLDRSIQGKYVLGPNPQDKWREDFAEPYFQGTVFYKKALEISGTLSNTTLQVRVFIGMISLKEQYFDTASKYLKSFSMQYRKLHSIKEGLKKEIEKDKKNCKKIITENTDLWEKSDSLKYLKEMALKQCNPPPGRFR